MIAYVGRVEDLSGLEPTSADGSDPDHLSPSQVALVLEIGKVYAPLLLANAKAVMSGADRVKAEIDGSLWTQNPLPYPLKCLNWLRDACGQRDPDSKQTLATVLAGTGCDRRFAGSESV